MLSELFQHNWSQCRLCLNHIDEFPPRFLDPLPALLGWEHLPCNSGELHLASDQGEQCVVTPHSNLAKCKSIRAHSKGAGENLTFSPG